MPGAAPLRVGTRDFASFFRGGLTRIRIWDHALTQPEITDLYASDSVPRDDSLVAELLHDDDTDSIAMDTAGNDGTIVGASWATQN
jgi:hypothetical protein